VRVESQMRVNTRTQTVDMVQQNSLQTAMLQDSTWDRHQNYCVEELPAGHY
jgi:hypothetical protein